MATNGVSSQNVIQDIIDRSTKKTDKRNTGTLGKDDFLNLLVTQLRYQDPLKPMEDKEFIAQMAQFSSLEQMQNMNGTMTKSQAFSLLGKYITANIADSQTNELKTVQGQVTNVKINDGKTYVVVNNQDILVDSIKNVVDAANNANLTNLSAYTNLIGYNVKGAVYDSKTSNVVAVTGAIKALEKGVYEDYAVMDDVTVEISGVNSDTPSTDPDYIKKYLDERLPKDSQPGKEVNLIVVDRKTNHKVPVTAVLQSYTKDADGKYKVTLDNVSVPVDSVARITK